MTAERRQSPARTVLARSLRATAVAAVRAEQALAARPVAWAVRLTAIYAGVVFLALTPTFESNDDTAMMFIADGTFYGEPQPHLVFQHPAVGVALSTLYRWTTSVNWYAVWLYSLHAAALAVLLYLVFSDRRTRLLARLVPLIGFGAAFTVWMWVNLQFTAVSITIGAAGILLFSSTTRSTRFPAAVPAAAGLLVAVSAFVRWRSFQAVVLLAAPVLAAGVRRISWRSHAWFASTIAVGVLAGGVFQAIYYAGDDAWHDYFEFNSVRGAVHATERIDAAGDPEVLAALGWSRADYDMFRSWFYLDEARYSAETLELLLDEVGTPLRHPTAVLDLAEGLDRFARLAVLGGLLAAAWAISDRRLVLAATTGWFIVVVTIVAVVARLPDRVAVPALGYLGMIYLVRPHGAFGETYRAPPRWAGRAAFALVTAISLVALGLACPRTAADSARWNRHNDAFTASMDELAAVDPEGVFVSWGGSVGTLRVSPELSERVPVTLLPLGWHQRSPMHSARLAELGIGDLYDAIARDDGVYLTLAADDPAAEWYLAYMEEHYGYTGFLRPSAAVDTDGRLTVYDLVVATYTLDEGRDVLVEVRGDGSNVDLPVLRRGVAGTFRASPNRPDALVGWAVDIEGLRPVERVVVIHEDRLVSVLPTTYLRAGEARAHGVDADARIGFVLGDLDADVVEEARVFALTSDSAVELSRGAR